MRKNRTLLFLVLSIMILFLCSSIKAEEVDSVDTSGITVVGNVNATDVDKNAIYGVITDFINKLASKNFEGAFEDVSLNYGAESGSSYNMFKENMENSVFKFLRDPLTVISSCNVIDINKFVINNDVADFYLNFSWKGSSSNNANETERIFKKKVRMIKENGTWRISEWQSDLDSFLPEIKETINKFIASIYSGNIDEAISYVSDRYADKVGNFYKFKQEIENRFAYSSLLMFCDNFIIKQFNSFFEDDVRLSICFECKEIKKEESVSEAINKNMFFSLKKEGDNWKISGSSLLDN